jgi:hypothetical protein
MRSQRRRSRAEEESCFRRWVQAYPQVNLKGQATLVKGDDGREMDVDSEEKPKQRLSQGKKLERDRDEVEVEDFAMDVDDDNDKLDGLKLERKRRKN